MGKTKYNNLQDYKNRSCAFFQNFIHIGLISNFKKQKLGLVPKVFHLIKRQHDG